ncbi:MAG: nucleotidyltransferase family protein [Candidatus Kerfeldbacteria bacterium]|nr:nucleotidyltransferase family protein [Candidatus Kerfeldbacteria bacterium]
MGKRGGKERLTITMRQDILASLDRFIDGDTIRNRSHGIEYIVGRYLGAGISTCVILAAGKSDQTTKPLLRIHNRPVIAYTIELLRQANITNIIMVISAGRHDLKKYLGDGSQWKVNITYVEDDANAGSAHSLSLAKPHIRNTFLLLYGDILTEIDLQELARFHREQDHIMLTLAVTACTNPSLYGVTELQGNRVYRIIEKPSSYNKSNLVFSGIAVCEPAVFEHLDNVMNKYLARDVFPDLAHRGQIAGYPFSNKWFDVSHKEEYDRATTEWITG